MHKIAKNIAAKLQNKLGKEDALVLYGKTLKYKQVFMGKMEGGEFVTIKEFIEGGGSLSVKRTMGNRVSVTQKS